MNVHSNVPEISMVIIRRRYYWFLHYLFFLPRFSTWELFYNASSWFITTESCWYNFHRLEPLRKSRIGRYEKRKIIIILSILNLNIITFIWMYSYQFSLFEEFLNLIFSFNCSATTVDCWVSAVEARAFLLSNHNIHFEHIQLCVKKQCWPTVL